MVDSEAQIYEVAREVAVVAKKVELGDPLRKYVDVLLEKCPLALDDRTMDQSDDINAEIKLDRLKTLHANIKYYVSVNERHQAEYRFLLARAWLLNDIIDNRANREKTFKSSLLKPSGDKFEPYRLQFLWWWYIYLQPICVRALSIICVVASLALVWSESTFQITSAPLSIPALLLKSHYISYAGLELVAISFILYMCACAYSTLFKVKIFDYYVMVPEHHTEEPTLLFVGAYLCRLTFPLTYNFLNMLNDDGNSVFILYQGEFIDLAPLLGEGFNTWVPELVLIFALMTLFNLYGRVLSLCKVKNQFYEEVT
ncbi:LMBR1 domain-containing protein 2, partial [Blyttiomyces sp. JEL0837]